jgi:hypothetical protein
MRPYDRNSAWRAGASRTKSMDIFQRGSSRLWGVPNSTIGSARISQISAKSSSPNLHGYVMYGSCASCLGPRPGASGLSVCGLCVASTNCFQTSAQYHRGPTAHNTNHDPAFPTHAAWNLQVDTVARVVRLCASNLSLCLRLLAFKVVGGLCVDRFGPSICETQHRHTGLHRGAASSRIHSKSRSKIECMAR